MTGQIRKILNKTCHPDMGCSGNLNSSGTVYLVNVGTSYPGLRAGLAAVEVGYGGRESRSSLSRGKLCAWRRTLASRKFQRK
jgi:hypothetical protein